MHQSFPALQASPYVMDAAIKTGRVDMLDFLHNHYSCDLGDTEVLSCSLAFAPREQWLAVAGWLDRHVGYRVCFSDYVLERVVESGDAVLFAFLTRVALSVLLLRDT